MKKSTVDTCSTLTRPGSHADTLGKLTVITCPACRGAKTHQSIVCYRSKPGGCQVRTEQCDTCQGTGSITYAQAEQIEQGKALRKYRVRVLEISQRDAGRAWGIDFVLLSKMEAGKVPIPAGFFDKIGWPGEVD